ANLVRIQVGGSLGPLAPRIISLTPARGEAGKNLAGFTISGANLGGVAGIEFSPYSGLVVADLKSTDTAVTAQLSVTPSAAAAELLVSVVSSAGRSNTLPFGVTPAVLPPSLSCLSPENGEAGGPSVSLTLFGADLAGVTGIEFVPAGGVTLGNLSTTRY